MRHRVLLLVLLLALSGALAGCASNDSGNREFIPGKGWVPTR